MLTSYLDISRWREQLEKLPQLDRDEMLFMLAPRWADDIRIKDRSQHRGPWHYTNFPVQSGRSTGCRQKQTARGD